MQKCGAQRRTFPFGRARACANDAPFPHRYRLISRQGEGTFSEVFKAQSVKTGRYTAIKCMKNKFDSIEQVRPRAERWSLCRGVAAAAPSAGVALVAGADADADACPLRR